MQEIKNENKFPSFRHWMFPNLLFRIIIISLNFIVFIKNINYLKKENKINQQTYNRTLFRDIDQFFSNFIVNSYEKMGNYFINKYNKNGYSSLLPKKNKDKKKIIHLWGVNMCYFWEFKLNIIFYLKDKFIFIFDKDNPDYLIYNTFGTTQVQNEPRYDNCIKIGIYTENTIPDLNQCDYAMGHAHINYLDRYFTLPFCFIRKLNETKGINYWEIRNKVLQNPRKKFCAAVISSSQVLFNDFFRLEFIDELNKYKIVDMGGIVRNNVGGRVKDKLEFLRQYKFSIAMENTEADGYSSEKIIDSFIAGTIPIYYGNYMIDEYFNPKALILIRGPQDMKQKIEYIKKIDNDDELYKSILKEKVLIDDKIIEKAQKEQSNFLIHIFSQDKIKAKRLPN